MRKLSIILLAGAAIMVSASLKAQDAVRMQTCEYWFDYDFEHRQSVAMNGNEQYTQQFDLSALPRGVHSIGLRFGDSKGLWTSPFVKHFVIPTLPAQTFDDNKIVRVEYWYDYDFDNRKMLEADNGNVAISLDVSEMARGVHSIGYRALDSRGIYTAPFVKHFVFPTLPEAAVTGIVAYEYWFNHGPRVRMEVEAQKVLDLQELVIEVKDVVPNAIKEGYRFNVENGIVYVDDVVTFGIQAFDNVGHPSSAVQSESFAYNVAVDTRPIALVSGVVTDFDAPYTGYIQGFTAEAAAGDSVSFVLNADARLDLYDETGLPVKTVKSVDAEDGRITYQAEAPTRKLHALVWEASLSVANIQIEYVWAKTTGVSRMADDCNVAARYNTHGQKITTPHKGVNIIRMSDGTVKKVLVK